MDSAIPTGPPLAGDEASTLLGSLERQRRTLAWKCGGLESAAMRQRLEPSAVTLGGLLKHLALVESHTFGTKLNGLSPGPPWDAVDWDADPDWEWHSAADDSPEALFELWEAAVAEARAAVERALADGGLEHRCAISDEVGEPVYLRRLLIDQIEEYARHVGQADLIRESIDGLTGEDPPG